MVAAWLQVLADGEQVAIHPAQVGEQLAEFGPGLAQADHDAALADRVRRDGPHPAEQFQAARVDCLRPGRGIKAGHGLQVVVEHLGCGGEHYGERLRVPLKVRDEQLDAGVGREPAHRPDRGGEVGRAAVRQVVAGHRGEHRVAQTEEAHRLGHVPGFLRVGRALGAVTDGAEPAGARAPFAEQQKGGGAAAEALELVGAQGLLADRGQLVVAQQGAQPFVFRTARQPAAQPGGLAGGDRFGLWGVRGAGHGWGFPRGGGRTPVPGRGGSSS